MKKVCILTFITAAVALIVLALQAAPRRASLKPGAAQFTIKPVFSNTAEVVNVTTTAPATVTESLDGVTNAVATTTDSDLQASFTVNQNADGSYPVVTVDVQ